MKLSAIGYLTRPEIRPRVKHAKFTIFIKKKTLLVLTNDTSFLCEFCFFFFFRKVFFKSMKKKSNIDKNLNFFGGRSSFTFRLGFFTPVIKQRRLFSRRTGPEPGGASRRPFRDRGRHTGRAVGQKPGGAPAARAARTPGQARRPVRRADRSVAADRGRAKGHRHRTVLPPDHRPHAHRTVRVRHVHQLPADRPAPADHHQQVQDMPLPAVTPPRFLKGRSIIGFPDVRVAKRIVLKPKALKTGPETFYTRKSAG